MESNVYKLYLDDKRPKPDGDEWVLAQSVHEFFQIVEDRGCPQHIDFDYYLTDFGQGMTGADVAREFISWLEFEDVKVPTDFSYDAHSSDDECSRRILKIMDEHFKPAAPVKIKNLVVKRTKKLIRH